MVSLLQLPINYLFWHYIGAWADVLRLYLNTCWFLWNFFSIRILSGTLLSPWHRIHEVAQKDMGGLLGSIIINLMLRGVGFVARTGTILIGLLSLIFFSVFFLGFLILWPFLPLLAVVAILTGVMGLAMF